VGGERPRPPGGRYPRLDEREAPSGPLMVEVPGTGFAHVALSLLPPAE
jgi:hypothetical protein